MSEKQLETMATEGEPDPTLVERFKAMCPHFFTSAIERHRRSEVTHPKPKAKLWTNVTRDIGGGDSAFVHLHIDSKLQKFEFRDYSGEYRWPVDENLLQQAVRSRGAHVGIKLGVDILRLNRAELLSAFNYLRALRAEKPPT